MAQEEWTMDIYADWKRHKEADRCERCAVALGHTGPFAGKVKKFCMDWRTRWRDYWRDISGEETFATGAMLEKEEAES